MSKSNQIVAGLIIIILIGVGLYFWYRTSIPTSSEIEAQKKQIDVVDANVLQSPAIQTMSSLNSHGDLPLQVKPEEIGREDPFANY